MKLQLDSEWAAPMFIIPQNTGTIMFISNVSELNKLKVHKPFPIPKISNVLLKQQGFQ